MRVNKILLPKNGYSIDECEDSISQHPLKIKKRTVNLKFAIADGATESSFSKEWATLLTSIIFDSVYITSKNLIEALPLFREKWKLMLSEKKLPWYAQQKVESGAFSTFLGLQINTKENFYSVTAIGDCCLFHVRQNKLIRQFPIEKSDDFGNNPYLLSSKPTSNELLTSHIVSMQNDLIKGDYILLMSDAIAHWFMKDCEKYERPWEIMIGLMDDLCVNNDSFELWLNNQRQSGKIKNDDTSVIFIEF